MATENETVEIGGVSVPKAFADRWNELLGINKKLKTQVQESQAALVLAQEEAATGSSKELETAKARILELEGDMEKSAWTTALSEDGLSDDEDVLEYLQYQYGKVTPKEGESKPNVKDWYKEVREKNAVVQAAKKVASTAKKDTTATDKTKKTEPTVDPKTGKTPVASTRTVPEKAPKQIPSDSSTVTPESLVQMDVRDFSANKANLRKQLFGS